MPAPCHVTCNVADRPHTGFDTNMAISPTVQDTTQSPTACNGCENLTRAMRNAKVMSVMCSHGGGTEGIVISAIHRILPA